jgi:DNA-binding MarR family transcriptional regulator
MSHKIRSTIREAVMGSGLSLTEAAVLKELAEFAGDQQHNVQVGNRTLRLQPWQTHVSLRTLAECCCCSQKTVEKIVASLERKGWLDVSRPADRGEPQGRGHVTIYTVLDPAKHPERLTRVGITERPKADTRRLLALLEKTDSRAQKTDLAAQKTDFASQKTDFASAANGHVSVAGRQNGAVHAGINRSTLTGDEEPETRNRSRRDAPASAAPPWVSEAAASDQQQQGMGSGSGEYWPAEYKPVPWTPVQDPTGVWSDRPQAHISRSRIYQCPHCGARATTAALRRRDGRALAKVRGICPACGYRAPLLDFKLVADPRHPRANPLEDPTPWPARADQRLPVRVLTFRTCGQCKREAPDAQFGGKSIHGVPHRECRADYGGCGARLPEAHCPPRRVTWAEATEAITRPADVADVTVGTYVEFMRLRTTYSSADARPQVGTIGRVREVYPSGGLSVEFARRDHREPDTEYVDYPWWRWVRAVAEARAPERR